MNINSYHNPDCVTPPPGFALFRPGDVLPASYLYWDSVSDTWFRGTRGAGKRIGYEYNSSVTCCFQGLEDEPI